MNEGASELLAAVALVVRAFDELGVDYLVGGSVASSVFGEPRQTVDADLVARLLGRHAEPLVSRLSGQFYIDLGSIMAANWMICMSDQTESSLATRPSLLARLKDWSQQTAWREFDHDYAPLLRNVARKSGLTEAEADEVAQETLIAVAKRIGEFQHAGRRGSLSRVALSAGALADCGPVSGQGAGRPACQPLEFDSGETALSIRPQGHGDL